jgi:hypothetical protein
MVSEIPRFRQVRVRAAGWKSSCVIGKCEREFGPVNTLNSFPRNSIFYRPYTDKDGSRHGYRTRMAHMELQPDHRSHGLHLGAGPVAAYHLPLDLVPPERFRFRAFFRPAWS